MLSKEEVRERPFRTVEIADSVFFPDRVIIEIDQKFYEMSNAAFPTNSYRQQIRMYNKQNQLILLDLDSGAFTELRQANVIKSYVQNFDGFAPGKKFQLDNNQVWEQIGSLSSPCTPGGVVWIKDNAIMRVGNWNFNVKVRRID